MAQKKPWWKMLGPGLITGASDDDPSGIATYSQVGAQFGTGMLWTMPFSYPLMAVTQEISARVGRVTGHGLAGNLRRHYPRPLLYLMTGLLLLANIINRFWQLNFAEVKRPEVQPEFQAACCNASCHTRVAEV